MMLRILTKRERIILSATVALFIFSIVFNFFISPVLKRVELLNKELSITKAKLRKYLQLISQKDYIKSKYNRFISGNNLVNPGQDNLVGALQELEMLAKNSNIRIVDIRPQGNSRERDLYKEIIINLRTEGTLENYLRFIYNIENSLTLFRVRKFQLNAKPNSQTLEGIFTIS